MGGQCAKPGLLLPFSNIFTPNVVYHMNSNMKQNESRTRSRSHGIRNGRYRKLSSMPYKEKSDYEPPEMCDSQLESSSTILG